MKNHKVHNMSDIITLSSDDEYEPAPKKVKASVDLPVQPLVEELRVREMYNSDTSHSTVVSTTDLPSTTFSITITPIKKSSLQQKDTDSNTSYCHEEKKSTNLNANNNNSNNTNDCLVISDDEPGQSDSEASCNNDVNINGSESCKETSLANGSSSSSDIAEVSESDTIEDKVATDRISETVEAVSGVESSKESTIPEYSVETETEHSELPSYMSAFLDACAKSLKNTPYETRVIEKFPKMKKNFNLSTLQSDKDFKSTVEKCIARAKISGIEAIQAYRDVNSHILDNVKGTFIEIPEENVGKVKKLEKFINKITRKIKKLDEAEVDFDSDKNSVYMQHDRYSRRLKQAYDKYVQLTGETSKKDRILFVSSHYNEINRAISHSYKYNKFPNYGDIEKVVRKCVKKHELSLNETEIKNESRECFIKLGNMLQDRRKKELYRSHRELLVTTDEGDPASKDPALAETLKKSAKQGKERLQEVMAKYASMQEKNEKNNVSEQPLSADSDDSHYESSSSGEDDG